MPGERTQDLTMQTRQSPAVLGGLLLLLGQMRACSVLGEQTGRRVRAPVFVVKEAEVIIQGRKGKCARSPADGP